MVSAPFLPLPGAAAHRCVDDVDAFGAGGLDDAVDEGGTDRAGFDEDRPRRGGVQHTVLAESHGLGRGLVRQRGEGDVGAGGGRSGAVGGLGTGRHQLHDRGRAQVADRQVEARALDAEGNVLAHAAEAAEADFHGPSP